MQVVQTLAAVCAVCNQARVEYNTAAGTGYRAVGASTEAALRVLTEKLGAPDPAVQRGVLARRQAKPDGNEEGACAEYLKK